MKQLLQEVLSVLEGEAPDPDRIEAIKNQVRGAIAGLEYNADQTTKPKLTPSKKPSPIDRVLEIVKRHPKGVPRSQITRQLQWLKHTERDEILGTLAADGLITITKTPSKGLPRTIITPAA